MSSIDSSLVVTVKVVTYNSSKYVLETLESIKAQTYPYLALVISDDCSTDKTVRICKEWVRKNQSRFVSTKILESPVNTGVSANGNRAEAACETKWVKGIAGDDLLLPNCIQDNMDYVAEHPDTVYLFSKIKAFGHSQSKILEVENALDYSFFDLTPKQQYEKLIFSGNYISAPTCFSNREMTEKLGVKNDERIPMLEDYPKWINALKKGVTFHFMDKITIAYRVSENSLTTASIPSEKFIRSQKLFYYYYLRDEYIKHFGLEKVINDEINGYIEIYNGYRCYSSLFTSKIYFYLFKNRKKKH